MARSFKPLLVLLSVFVFTCERTPVSTSVESGVSWSLAQDRKERVSVINYKLEFRVPKSQEQQIQSLLDLNFNLSDASKGLLLDFKAPTENIKGIIVNGKSHEIIHENEHITLLPEFLQEGFNRVEINFYAGEQSLNRKSDYLYTLFVPDRARTAFPCFDQPNLKATFDLTLDIPEDWNAIANAPVVISKAIGGRRTINYAKSDLMSTYLFSFVAGKFEAVTREYNGRAFTMLHRETDEEKVNRNLNFIFYLHSASIQWLEQYTGIKYPFKKLDFALIPAFQYGGMEHVGAIQYRANSLFLDEDPSQSQLLSRASLIAHEVAHMWFGNLVTMDWFNDVWTKEVFANFMAAKMVNPSFPTINHDLNFLVRHYPSAYSVDRTSGSNPIRQELNNLNEAGQMYGPIIYNKAPIMMRQLELLIGEEEFQRGMRAYLNTYANKNATWPDLIEILDGLNPVDLKKWSEVWVNQPGRPVFSLENNGTSSKDTVQLVQKDPKGKNSWPQGFRIKLYRDNARVDALKELQVFSGDVPFNIEVAGWEKFTSLMNSDAVGYGLFPSNFNLIRNKWNLLNELERGSFWVNHYENLLEPSLVGVQDHFSPMQYMELLQWSLNVEENQLLLTQVLRQIRTVNWSLLREDERQALAKDLEAKLYQKVVELGKKPDIQKLFFNAFQDIAITDNGLNALYQIWLGDLTLEGLSLSERDLIGLASTLAIKLEDKSEVILSTQLEQINNPDAKRRFQFLLPALSANQSLRDEFFESLKTEENRQTENWVLSGLSFLHHPLRRGESIKYIKPSLDLLKEIQETGDIFFPKGWLDRTLSNHNSAEAVEVVMDFLKDNPDYNHQLKLKILQSIDFGKRASEILKFKAKK